jgi:uncharacterized membrane protein
MPKASFRLFQVIARFLSVVNKTRISWRTNKKMNFETSKNLGGIGAILMFISPFATYAAGFGGILGLVGLILLLIGANGLAKYYREAGIFNNMLYGTIVGIVGGVISVFAAVWAIIALLPDFIHKIYPGWNGDWTTLPNITPNPNNITASDVVPFIGAIFAVIVILFVVAVVVAFFFRKSFSQLSTKTGVGLFGTTGTVLLVGAVLIIAFGFGLLLVWISMLLLAIAFFRMRPSLPQTETPPPPPQNVTQI